ncbi:DUF3592 domain-containing protein [Dasania sp. GY-MA-18]|uniref:DUF3592 domain-containing protein n=1 Tax=Dasania phycosphaerae TaxID=2950436 RepID=A0A9J6RHZ8_9GAMM|nr:MULTISPECIES: DUF3592 domain-containing protein [Dasania]MCR8921647.1 DUF3592 domain-containing protein [Dasania sp. GY-MA-18]MCZ0864075.1 DUF3592 domain-containing protein [Dasania phycosphaerae]MCZ0867803.1 DUF3592 domain-containing protein [Dasania phycosphaerae]
MNTIYNMLLITINIVVWVVLSDIATGAPTTILNYYNGNYTETGEGKILRSRQKSGRYGAGAYDIKYEYFVNNRYYISDQVNFKINSYNNAKETIIQYPEGKKVSVYYDAEKPEYSTLELTGIDFGVYGQLLCTFIMILIGHTILPFRS